MSSSARRHGRCLETGRLLRLSQEPVAQASGSGCSNLELSKDSLVRQGKLCSSSLMRRLSIRRKGWLGTWTQPCSEVRRQEGSCVLARDFQRAVAAAYKREILHYIIDSLSLRIGKYRRIEGVEHLQRARPEKRDASRVRCGVADAGRNCQQGFRFNALSHTGELTGKTDAVKEQLRRARRRTGLSGPVSNDVRTAKRRGEKGYGTGILCLPFLERELQRRQ